MSKLEEIALLCARECLKQNVGVERVGMLLEAYAYAEERASLNPEIEDALYIARVVEPNNKGVFRRTPVTFANGGSAADASAIPGAIERLFEHVDGADPRAWVKAFLDIHPFTDGNGRTAFVLFNWLSRAFNDPQPLPDLFGV